MSDEKTLVGAVKTEQGVEVKGMLMQPVVEKCEGCDRVRTFEEQQFCGSYPNPAKKWFDGRCNFATHIKTESGKAAKVNPLKRPSVLRRVVKPFGSVLLAGMHRNFFENARLWEGRSPKGRGRLRLPPFLFSEAVHEEHMTRFSRLIESIGQQRDKVIEYQTRMTELPALGPENGGTGEMPKALYLEGCCVSSA